MTGEESIAAVTSRANARAATRGWWSVSISDAHMVTPEVVDAMLAELDSAAQNDTPIVAVDGVTFTWHKAGTLIEPLVAAVERAEQETPRGTRYAFVPLEAWDAIVKAAKEWDAEE